MTRDPQADLVFSHNLPSHVAIGVDLDDAQRLIARIERWEDWCRLWSEEAARHEALAREATDKGQAVSAAEAYVRAAIHYHCGKHLFLGHADEWRAAHDSVVRCYVAGAPDLDHPLLRLTFPYWGVEIPGWLRRPRDSVRSPVAIFLPGLDACKEELHVWAAAFAARGMATLTIDGPGQGESSVHLPITHEWGRVIGAVTMHARIRGSPAAASGAYRAPRLCPTTPILRASTSSRRSNTSTVKPPC